MLLAEVVGTVVATRKDEGLDSRKFLVVQPLTPSGAPTGSPLVALDAVGVGTGERVFYVRGREASFPFLPVQVPADATIVGKVDQISSVEREPSAKPRRTAKK